MAIAYRRKMLAPEYGNYVDHDLLFGGQIQTPAYSPFTIVAPEPGELPGTRYGDNARSPVRLRDVGTRNSGLRRHRATSMRRRST